MASAPPDLDALADQLGVEGNSSTKSRIDLDAIREKIVSKPIDALTFHDILEEERKSDHKNIERTLDNLQQSYDLEEKRIDGVIREVRLRNDQLVKRMNAAESKNEDYDRRINQKQKLITQLQDAQKYLGKQFVESRKNVVSLNLKKQQLQKTIEEQNNQITDLKNEKARNKEKISSLSLQIKAKEDEIASMQQAMEQAKKKFLREKEEIEGRLLETRQKLNAERSATAAVERRRSSVIDSMRKTLELDITKEQGEAMRGRLTEIMGIVGSLVDTPVDTPFYSYNGDGDLTREGIVSSVTSRVESLNSDIDSRIAGLEVEDMSTQVGITPRIDILSQFVQRQGRVSELVNSGKAKEFLDAVQSGERQIENKNVMIDEVVRWTLGKGMTMARFKTDIDHFTSDEYSEINRFVEDTNSLIRRIKETGGSPNENSAFIHVTSELGKLQRNNYFKSDEKQIALRKLIDRGNAIIEANSSADVEEFMREANLFMNSNTDNVRLLLRFRPPTTGEDKVYTDIASDNVTLKASFQPNDDSACAWLANKTGSNQLDNLKLVFDPEKRNSDVFSELKQFVDLSKEGYPVIVSVYGHSGAGKTYTMFGDASNGITQMTMQYLNDMTDVSDVKIGFVTFAPTKNVSIDRTARGDFTQVRTYSVNKKSDNSFTVSQERLGTAFKANDITFNTLGNDDVTGAVDELRRKMWFPTDPNPSTKSMTFEFENPVGIRPTSFNQNGSSRLHICVVFRYTYESETRMLTMIDMAGVENLAHMLIKMKVNTKENKRVTIRKALNHEDLFKELFSVEGQEGEEESKSAVEGQDGEEESKARKSDFSNKFLSEYIHLFQKSSDWSAIASQFSNGLEQRSIDTDTKYTLHMDDAVITGSTIILRNLGTKIKADNIIEIYNNINVPDMLTDDSKTKITGLIARIKRNPGSKFTLSRHNKIMNRLKGEAVMHMIANMARESVWINESLNTFRWWLMRERDGVAPSINKDVKNITERSGFALMDSGVGEDACEYTFWRDPTDSENPYHFVEILDSIKNLSKETSKNAKLVVIANMHSTGDPERVAPAAMFLQQLGNGSAQTGSASSQSVTKQETSDNGETESTGTDDESVKEKKPVEQGEKERSPSKPDSEQAASEGKGIDDESGLSEPDSEQETSDTSDSESEGVDEGDTESITSSESENSDDEQKTKPGLLSRIYDRVIGSGDNTGAGFAAGFGDDE